MALRHGDYNVARRCECTSYTERKALYLQEEAEEEDRHKKTQKEVTKEDNMYT